MLIRVFNREGNRYRLSIVAATRHRVPVLLRMSVYPTRIRSRAPISAHASDLLLWRRRTCPPSIRSLESAPTEARANGRVRQRVRRPDGKYKCLKKNEQCWRPYPKIHYMSVCMRPFQHFQVACTGSVPQHINVRGTAIVNCPLQYFEVTAFRSACGCERIPLATVRTQPL